MKILNTGSFYYPKSEGVYKGYIKLTEKEFNKAIKSILNNKEVSELMQGSGPYAYLSKKMLREDLVNTKIENEGCTQYALRVSVASYINSMFKNESRYYYKPQNYIIQVTKDRK